MKVAVFGANGPTGRLVVEQALAAGHHVTAATRKPDEFPLTSPHLEVVASDVMDPQGVERVIAGSQAVISTYGVPYSTSEITVYSHGITNIMQSMTSNGIDRLVCVSSTTVATEAAPGESLLWRKVIGPYLRNKLGRTLYDDMQRMKRWSNEAVSTGQSCVLQDCSTPRSPPTTTRSHHSDYPAGSPPAPTSQRRWSARPPNRNTHA